MNFDRGIGSLSISGREESSFVNTEAKNLLRISAFSWGSLCIVPQSSNEATPQ